MRLWSKIVTGLAVVAFLAAAALLVSSQKSKERIGRPNVALCEHVMRQAYVEGTTLATRPAECEGVEQAELEAIVARILEEEEPSEPAGLTSQ